MKEFTNKKNGSFGFIIDTFIVDGVEWANVISFSFGSGKRKLTVKVSDLVIE